MNKKEALKTIKNVFNNLQIHFALIGAYAAAIWGIVRAAD